MRRLDPIGVIEACYRQGDDAAWAGGLLEALAPLEQGCGAMAVAYAVPSLSVSVLVRRGEAPDVDRLVRSYQAAPPEILRSHLRPCPPVDRATRRGATTWPPVRDILAAAGMDDALGMMSQDHDGQAFFIWIPIHADRAPSPRTLHHLSLITAHIVSARRLRALDAAGAPPRTDAVLTPDGRLRGAQGRAEARAVRHDLSEAVRRIERARGRARREDADGALAIWHGLVDGEWSLVDHVEADGRRLVLARRNPPGGRDPKALTPGERAVLGYAALGHSNKFIGYMLGRAPTTIATHLASAQRKLGVGSRLDLVGMLASRGDGASSPAAGVTGSAPGPERRPPPAPPPAPAPPRARGCPWATGSPVPRSG